MNSPVSPLSENPGGSITQSNALPPAVKEELDFFAHQLKLAIVSILIATAGMGVYLLWQYRQVKREYNARVKVVEQIGEEQKKMNSIVDPLREYGRTHPDYAPLLRKVGLAPSDSPPSAIQAPK